MGGPWPLRRQGGWKGGGKGDGWRVGGLRWKDNSDGNLVLDTAAVTTTVRMIPGDHVSIVQNSSRCIAI